VTNWNSGTHYTIGQVVFCTTCSVNGSSFVALVSNMDTDPPANSAIWQLIAAAGATGATGAGAQGPIGATGPEGATGTNGTAGATGATGSIANGFIWSSLTANEGNNGTFFTAPLGSNAGNQSDNSQLSFLTAPAACTVRSLTINALVTNVANPIVADSMVFTVVKNDVATTMTCPIATANGTANNATLSCSDSTHTFSVAQGDRISLQFVEIDLINNGAGPFISAGATLVCN
jgi:hypothetical protein